LTEDVPWMEQNPVISLFRINTQLGLQMWNWTYMYKEHHISVVHLFWLLCWLVYKELIHKNGWHCQTKLYLRSLICKVTVSLSVPLTWTFTSYPQHFTLLFYLIYLKISPNFSCNFYYFVLKAKQKLKMPLTVIFYS